MTFPRLTIRAPVYSGRWRRVNFSNAVAAYAAALGAAAVLVSILIRVELFSEPRLFPFAESTIYALAGGFAGGLLAWPLAYFVGEQAYPTRGLLPWLGLGLAFGIALPFLTGLFLPTASAGVDLLLSRTSGSELALHMADVAALSIRYTIIHTTVAMPTTLLAGALLGIGGWAIDKANASPRREISGFGLWVLALAFGSGTICVVVWGPAETLAKLG